MKSLPPSPHPVTTLKFRMPIKLFDRTYLKIRYKGIQKVYTIYKLYSNISKNIKHFLQTKNVVHIGIKKLLKRRKPFY